MAQSPRLGDVIIPAYNEAAVIGRCLAALTDGLAPGDIQIIVAANGCRDETVDVARSFDPSVVVLDLPQASKPAAIRAAERLCGPIPRLYLDADVELSGRSAALVLDRLNEGALAARPRIRYQTDDSTFLVRSYYRARSANEAVMGRLWGAGVYGLSPAGRERLGEYPDVVAEDLWVDRHFDLDEIDVVDSAEVVVYVPRDLAGLRKILRRARRGTADLDEGAAPRGQDGTGSTLRGLAEAAAHGPQSALDACVYGALATLARVDLRFTRTYGWERDETSRQGARPT